MPHREYGVGTDCYDGEPWVAAMDLWPLYDETDFAELASMDRATTPDHFIGRLTWCTKSLPSTLHQQLVSDSWPSEALSAVGAPPATRTVLRPS
ncbi:hypothetical protein [Streptomyces sp. NPDC002588]|uniref:hypothetical protein n=1 Tax=Streptomyces sp. NPDC002588 TaxID=3154419 RepID=UPI003319724A